MRGVSATCQWWGPALVSTPGVVGLLAGRQAVDWGAWQGDAWSLGEGFRWFTAHWLALNAEHWLVNAMVWLALWSLSRRRFRAQRWVAALTIIPWALSLSLFVSVPNHPPYLGSSGLAYAVWTQEALVQTLRGQRRLGLAMLMPLVVHLFGDWQHLGLPRWNPTYAAAVSNQAHWLGASWGFFAGLNWVVRERSAGARRPGGLRQVRGDGVDGGEPYSTVSSNCARLRCCPSASSYSGIKLSR